MVGIASKRQLWAGMLTAWLLAAPAAAAVDAAASQDPAVQGAGPRLRIHGVADGLPSTTVNAIARDRAGYVWAATLDGLARYDGTGFRVWRHVPGLPGALPGNHVQALHVDGRDRVWVGTEGGGLAWLGADRARFRRVTRASHPQMGSDDVWSIASDDEGVWFGTFDGGLHRLDATGAVQRWTMAHGLPSDTILALLPVAGGLWIGTDAGVARFDGRRMRRVAMPGPAPHPLVYSLARDGELLWVGTSAGVFRRDRSGAWRQPAWSPLFERPNALTALVRDRAGALWLGSQRGLQVLDGDGAQPRRIDGGLAKPVPSLLLQPDGALWAPVPGEGLGYLRADWRRLREFTRGTPPLRSGLYRAVARDGRGGILLAGFDGVIERMDRHGAVAPVALPPAVANGALRVFSIAEDPSGALWIGHRGGLLRVRGNEVRAWTPDGHEDAVPPGAVDQLRVAADGTLWLVAQGGGVQQRDLASGRVLATVRADGAPPLDAGDIEAMELDADGAPWIANAHGLSRWLPATRRFAVVEGARGTRVHAFAFAGADHVWLHRPAGLQRLERRAGQWQRAAGMAAELPAVEASALRVDAHGRPWLSTTRGLFRFDPRDGRTRRFGVQQGFRSQEFLDRAMAIDAQGRLVVAAADGSVVVVDTGVADPQADAAALRVDQFAVRASGRWVARAPGRPLVLQPEEHEVRIGAHLLAFEDPQANRYWSHLDGFDRDWVAHGSNGARVFTGLGTGRHVLRLRAADGQGTPAREQVLHLRVQPPWWAGGAAVACWMLLAAAGVHWAARAWQARQARARGLALEQQARLLAERTSDAKSRFLATLGHEVRTPMTGVLGMAELLLGADLGPRERAHAQAIHGAGRHLLHLLDDALDLARIEAGKLDIVPAPFQLRAVLEDVAALHAPLARARGLAYRMDIPPGLAPAWCGDAMRLRQVLLNLGANAIKFTESGGVVVAVRDADGPGLRIDVTDTGPGLDDVQRARLFGRFEQADGQRTAARFGGSGLGLAISRELVSAMGGSLGLASKPGSGSTFSVMLPWTPAEVEDAAAPPSPTPPPAARPLDILLVEDDATAAQALAGLLEARGHRVRHAPHALAALAGLEEAGPDLAFLDLDLPGLDGFGLARVIRARGLTMPLVALTARVDAGAEAGARAAGMDGFLRKPVAGAQLEEAIVQAIA